MTLAWMLYLLLVSALIACGAVALEGLVRRTRVPVRWVWAGALAAVVVCAVVAPRGNSGPIEVPVTVSQNAGVPLTLAPTRASGLFSAIATARAAMTSSMTNTIGLLHGQLPASAVSVLQGAWMMGSAAVVLLLLGVSHRLRHARREWPRAEIAGTPVRIAPAVGPAVVGITRPEIVLPQWLLSRSSAEQRLIVVHEREHVTARDHLLLTASWGVGALLPWVPAVWFMMSRLRLAIELDCDARVLARGVRARSYGALLIDIAGECAGHRVGALALADKTSHLERRLLAMRNSNRPTVARTMMLAGVAALSIVMACEARLPTTAEIDKMNVAETENRAAKSGLFGGEDKVYFLNDVSISAARARAIATDSIVSIDIRKARPGANDEIRIRTTAVEVAGHLDSVRPRARTRVDSMRSHSGTRVLLRDGQEIKLRPSTSEERLPFKTGFNGIILIDGVKSSQDKMNALSPNEISAVSIRKGASAAAMSSDPAAANGIIEVTTLRATKKP